jgi:hypothetical protein
MPTFGRVIVWGAIAIIVFDAVAAAASRQFGFKYTAAAFGSYLLYAAVGYLASRAGTVSDAGAAGAAMGMVDATLGWAVSWAIGPGRMPDGTLTVSRWVVTLVVVTIIAAICGALGGFAGRLACPPSAPAV